MKKHSPKFLLGFSLAISLSGCVDYGNYPIPNAQACFINPTTVNAKQQGLRNLAFQKAKQGIPVKTLVTDYLIPATNKLLIDGNAQPLNALYTSIQPQTLANFMIGCNQVMVQERNQMIQQRNQEIKGVLTSQHYLNTTPAPQPTYVPITKLQATGTCSIQYFNTHPEIHKAGDSVMRIYMSKPIISTFNIRTLLQRFIHITLTSVENNKITIAETEQQLQQSHQQLQEIHQLKQQTEMGKTLTQQLKSTENKAASAPPWARPALSGIINYEKAVIASQNGTYMPLLAIYSQVQPPAWRNYFVGCYQLAQKDHATAKVDTK